MECRNVVELVSAFLDGALDEPEEMQVVAHLADCDGCTSYLTQFRQTSRWLSDAGTPGDRSARLSPPTRSSLLTAFREWNQDAAVERWEQVLRAASSWCPYGAQVLALDALLCTLPDSAWREPVRRHWNTGHPNWTVGNLISHLSAVDSLLAEQVGVEVGVPSGTATGDHAARTDAVLEADISLSRDRIRERWFAQAARICGRLPQVPLDTVIDVTGPLRLWDAMTVRAVETWVHTTDIAETVHTTAPVPERRYLTRMAELGVRRLPQALEQCGHPHHGRTAEVILSGVAGDRWVVPLGPEAPDQPDTRITMDVIEFCLLTGGRRDPATVAYTAEGDRVLARDLILAAPAFAAP
jgi:uncharacterized protein (TIGR03083 family)